MLLNRWQPDSPAAARNQSALFAPKMEFTQNRGLTLCFSKVMLDRSEYENLAAAAKKFYVQECKESKLQKALDAAMKTISELKAKAATLTAELTECKSVRGQLRTLDLEKENRELRSKLCGYENVISRNNLWSYFSHHRKNKIGREELR